MARIDNTPGWRWKVILFNKRMHMYRYYIELAKQHGYKICSMEQFYQDMLDGSEEKHLVLRHDIDFVSAGTRRMFETEKSCGVVSTYYFRGCTIDQKLMNEMVQQGFEVGYHYETLGAYADEKGLDAVSDEDIAICRERLKKEIEEFNELLPGRIKSICSHGSEANARIGCSNNVLTEDASYAYYGIEFEAYDREMYERYVTEHIMDSPICNNYGFGYSSNPIDAIEAGKKNIIFLAHPGHWHQSFTRTVKDLIKMCLGRYTNETTREFKRIAVRHDSN